MAAWAKCYQARATRLNRLVAIKMSGRRDDSLINSSQEVHA